MNYSIILPYRDKYDLFLIAFDSIPDRDDIQIIIVDNAVVSLTEDQIPAKTHAHVDYTTSSSTKGAGCARNEGLKHVKGNRVLFLDADDYFTPNAFEAFDKYIDKDYDIVFFKPASIRLSDGAPSNRHDIYVERIDEWYKTGDERRLRYRWGSPWAKLYRAEYLLSGGFQFEEQPVSNDLWFSLQTGHNAKRVCGDASEVYVVTEGGKGQSLIKSVTRENSFIRYETAIRINKFLKSVGHYEMHIRLLGSLRLVLKNFGLGEFFRYLKYAAKEKVSIF
jgi:glycosyltransferase involved in cell wall biosynthesis